ncbi:MAG: hypothetical protein APF77_15800 [Clostridia bacterium BRH_c25]|nr:MAG: hypothetical protein APF77_15800 [Clostridia bacterium BRH_c25]
MANKKVEIMIDDARIVAELYVDKAPVICNMILANPGQRAVVQHAKLNGQLIFGTLPYACGFENKCRGGDLDMFDLAYYPPRCQLCITYSIIEMPYVIRTVTANLVGLETSFKEASLVLGATPVKTLFNVTLPCIKQGIIGGAVFSFVVAFDECVIILFMKSAKTVTFPLRLYSYITESFTPLISAYATLFIIVAAVVIYIVERKIGLSKLY